MVVGHVTPSALTPIATSGALIVLVLLQPIVTGKEGKGLEMTLLASGGMTHDWLLLARAIRSRRGLGAWAPCRTLVRILRRTVGAGQDLGKRLALPCLEGTGSLRLGLTKSDSAS